MDNGIGSKYVMRNDEANFNQVFLENGLKLGDGAISPSLLKNAKSYLKCFFQIIS